jgi:predicted acyl esterase
MTRPLRGPLNPTNVDHSTDAYDTIDWLVKNVPESNGKVGVLGISYDGFTALMALFHPHPALRAAMPINPMVDGWMGDDWSHNGAFRQLSLTFTSDVLTAPLKISGSPIVNLIASTTGTDGDFVVKLIDVYPDEVGREPKMGGFQLMASADIFRGRYLDGFDKPRPIRANEKERYRFNLPDANHVFLPGHRLMIQVQSSWFPLYDRNPQTYVSNIFLAKPGDYKKASIKVFNAGEYASFVELPVVKNNPKPR